MCRSSDPYCFAATVSFDSLDDGLPTKPLPVTVVDRLPGRTFPPPPADLSRVLFFPKHNSKVTHLPVYEITDAYRQAVKEAALGSNMYKINMMFMSRPKGDGTDAEVCFFVDVASDKSRVTIEERSMTTGRALPPPCSSLAVSGLGVFDIHASANRSYRTDETGRPLGTDFRQYPALTMKSDAHPGTQWQVRSEDPGSLCYYLMESSRDQKSHKESLRVHAIYHYAGATPIIR
ncbi:hypothetical protein Ct61P_07353 [Colletotrichum tofieldiae]|nr:hypothetical protein Ct61P_07353 [Colletotrichum tofieldiae]